MISDASFPRRTKKESLCHMPCRSILRTSSRKWINTPSRMILLRKGILYIYSGWRGSELILMPVENIDLKEGTFKGGRKTAAGKNRIVPIHSKIRSFVEHRLDRNHGILFALNDRPVTTGAYTKLFKQILKDIGISTYHTPHDCRHTFTSLLDSAGVNQVCIDRLIGHASASLTTRTYTHKTLEELRQAIK